MDLRQTHEHPRVFDAILIILALVGAAVFWFGLRQGGAWIFLAISAGCGEALLGYGCFIEPKRLTVAFYREALVREPTQWIRVIFLSDLHQGTFKHAAWVARVAREAQALRPDLIFLGGDYVVDRVDPITDLAPLVDLRAPLGRFFVLGNHDLLDDPREIRRTLRRYGYEDLTDRHQKLERGGRTLEIQGVDDHWYGDPRPFTRTSEDIPHLLISHEPDVLLDLAEADTDLVLSGHTHAGQVRLPFMGPLWPVPSKHGREISNGRHLIRGIITIVSNGLGEQDARCRLFAPPQIVCVDVGI